MDLHELKNLLEEAHSPRKDRVEIGKLLRTKTHPVLRAVHRQVIIEAMAWAIFLLLFYTAFDASTKPLWVGFPVVVSVSAYLTHLAAGYSRMVATPANSPLADSLTLAYTHMKRFALRNLLLRSLVLITVLFFFSYGIEFTPAKYGALAALAIVFIVQLLVNHRLWSNRLRRLQNAITGLTSS